MADIIRGSHIITTEDANRDDWAIERDCQWGSKGTVLKYSNSHGLCYFVLHTDGTECWYDCDEVKRDE